MSDKDCMVEDSISAADNHEEDDQTEGNIDVDDLSEEEKKQFEAHKLASMCYCEKLNSKDEEDDNDENDKLEKVKFADTVVVCPTYTSQV